MPDCELLQCCAFFNDQMPIESVMRKMLKDRYCLGQYSTCARYQIATRLGRAAVPDDLYPNMDQRANDLLAAA